MSGFTSGACCLSVCLFTCLFTRELRDGGVPRAGRCGDGGVCERGAAGDLLAGREEPRAAAGGDPARAHREPRTPPETPTAGGPRGVLQESKQTEEPGLENLR